MFCPTALSMTNLKLHKKLAMDNTFTQEKLLHRLTFNPGLALTGFRTTWPRGIIIVTRVITHYPRQLTLRDKAPLIYFSIYSTTHLTLYSLGVT